MNQHDVISANFVMEESSVSDYVTAVDKSGGKLAGPPGPYTIPAELLDDYSDAQFEPLMVVAATVAVGFLVKRISDVWLDHKRPGGQVVDTRGGQTVIRVAPYLERGTLVLQSDRGVQVFRPEKHDEALPVLGKLLSAHD